MNQDHEKVLDDAVRLLFDAVKLLGGIKGEIGSLIIQKVYEAIKLHENYKVQQSLN